MPAGIAHGAAEWAAKVAVRADLGDKRRNERMACVLAVLGTDPASNIPQAAGCEREMDAAYRFFSNEHFSHEQLAASIGEATAQACSGHDVLYCVQDTTSLNYSNLAATQGLGPINDSERARGLHMHSSLAVDARGIVRGVLDVQIWARRDDAPGAESRYQRCIEEKESYKWIRGIRHTTARFESCVPATTRPRLIHVTDREGDVYEVFAEILERGDGAIVRCVQNRRVEGEDRYAHEAVANAPLLGTMTVDVPPKPEQPRRRATLELRSVRVTLRPNTKKHPKRQPLTLTLVLASEVGAPPEIEPLCWRLWTCDAVETLEEAIAVVQGYCLRWRVEEFHLVLKSGCRIERLLLETAERLSKAITVYAAVAARIVAVRDLGRRDPNAPCTEVLSDDEWHVLALRFTRKAPGPNQPVPTIRQAMCWIARLGGYLGRKGDGLPGVRTLWRGWRDLELLVVGWRIGRHIPACPDLRGSSA